MSAEGSYQMSVRRRMPAPRDVVYQAWIDPEGIREWMCPGDVVSANATLDVRVGGAYRIVMKSQQQEHVHTGVYQVVEPPAKLVFTWHTGDNDPHPTLVTVEFLERGAQSEIVITHERFPQADSMKRYEGGWGTIAEKLATYLASPARRKAV